MRRSAEKTARTRQRIVDAARGALLEYGPEMVSIARLMGGLGLTHGGFYAHFRSKGDLVAVAVDAVFEDVTGRCEAACEAAPDGLAAVIQEFLGSSADEQRQGSGSVVALAASAKHLPLAAQLRVTLGLQRLISALQRALDAPGLDPARTQGEAAMLLSELLGAALLIQASGDADADALVLKQGLVRLAMERRLTCANNEP